MSKKNTQLRKYSVRMNLDGDVERIVMAASEEEAMGKVKKMLLAEDGQTPKSNALNAFCWDARHVHASIHWSDLTKEEREESRKEALGLDKPVNTEGEPS